MRTICIYIFKLQIVKDKKLKVVKEAGGGGNRPYFGSHQF